MVVKALQRHVSHDSDNTLAKHLIELSREKSESVRNLEISQTSVGRGFISEFYVAVLDYFIPEENRVVQRGNKGEEVP